MTRRRGVAAAGLLALLAVTSGCVGFLVGDEPASFSASKATVSDEALSETEYQEQGVRDVTLNETVDVGGQSRDVTVTNWIAQYQRSVDLGLAGSQQVAMFALFTTPEGSVLGQSVNPVGRISEKELVERASSRSNLKNMREVGTTKATVLGEETEVTKFAATATIDGQELDVYVHVTKVKHDGDYVVAVAVYPQKLDGEEERVMTLIESVEHGG